MGGGHSFVTRVNDSYLNRVILRLVVGGAFQSLLHWVLRRGSYAYGI